MLKKRIIITLTFKEGVLFRTKNFKADYRYTKNFIDFWYIDEIVLIDVSKQKFTKPFLNIVKFFSENCFVPIAVGGGIQSVKHADQYFGSGADKILLSPRTSKDPKFLVEISKKYGNQSIIQSIDFLKKNNEYFLCENSGQDLLKKDPREWAFEAIEFGAGEVLLNSIDNDGSLLGYDLKFVEEISKNLKCPILALGGCGNWDHMLKLLSLTSVSAACTQNIYHFTNESIKSAKNFLELNKINIRK